MGARKKTAKAAKAGAAKAGAAKAGAAKAGAAKAGAAKAMGMCPHCEERVRAVVDEENRFRRDALHCPKCKERVLVCATPGCKNYAIGGGRWDDTFCPDCTSEAVGALKKVGTVVAVTLAAMLTKGKIKPK